MDAAGDTQQPWWVICLCAAWCGTCREWRPAFEAAARADPDTHFAWVDVEDEADAMGDIDIETFPTLLVAHGQDVRFFGPVLPSGQQFTRLLASLRGQSAGAGIPASAHALLRSLADSVLPAARL